MIIGVDAGNFCVKTVSEKGVDYFRSNICPYRELRLEAKHGEDDMVVEWNGKKYFAGTIAKYEDLFGSETLAGETKNHDEANLRMLIAVHRQVDSGEKVFVVVGQPISRHTDTEKEGIINRLKGSHKLTINGIEKEFEIVEARVAPEGGASFWCQPAQGKFFILDIGSGTVNFAALLDGKFINAKSGTMPFGMASDETATPEYVAEAINRRLSKKWGRYENIWLVGGGASQCASHLREYFPNAKELKPVLKSDDESAARQLKPDYANAVGFYNMAKKTFQQ